MNIFYDTTLVMTYLCNVLVKFPNTVTLDYWWKLEYNLRSFLIIVLLMLDHNLMLGCCVGDYQERQKVQEKRHLQQTHIFFFFRNEGRKHFLMFTSINYKKIISELKGK